MAFFCFFLHFWLENPSNAETTEVPAFTPPVRILHLHDAPHIRGGATHYLETLLEEWQSRGHSQGLFSMGAHASSVALEAHVFSYSRSNCLRQRQLQFHGEFPEFAASLKMALDSFQPEILHLQNWPIFRPTLYRVLGDAGIPVVQTVHDQALIDPNPSGYGHTGVLAPARRFLNRKRIRRSYQLALATTDAFFCPSLSIAHDLGLPQPKSILVRLPVTHSELQHSSAPKSERLHLLFAGALYRSKGPDLLLRALAQLPKSWKLSIAGEGDQEKKLKSLCSSLNLEGQVSFLGQLAEPDLLTARMAADLAVIPSRVPETASWVALESGALGLPVVASNAGGMPETLAPPARGWLFQPDSVEDLTRTLLEAADSSERQRRAMKFQAWIARECEPSRHFDKQEDLYKSLAATRSPGGAGKPAS